MARTPSDYTPPRNSGDGWLNALALGAVLAALIALIWWVR